MSAYFQEVFWGVDGPELTQIWGGQGGICVNNCSYERDLTDVSPPKIKKTAEIRWNGGGFPFRPFEAQQ